MKGSILIMITADTDGNRSGKRFFFGNRNMREKEATSIISFDRVLCET